jgi:Ca2+-binding EF-hand superfamily protein
MSGGLRTKKLSHLFAVFDSDGNGVVEVDDFFRVLDVLAERRGWTLGTAPYKALRRVLMAQWQAVAVAADPPGSGVVKLDGWMRHWEALADAAYDAKVAPWVGQVFDSIDTDGDGALTLDECRDWFAAFLGKPEEADVVFPACDADKDGRIRKTDWEGLAREFFCSDDAKARGNVLFGRAASARR